MQDLQVTLAGATLATPLLNAAGTCKHLEGHHAKDPGVRELATTDLGGIVVGSATPEERSGNIGDVWYDGVDGNDVFTLNSIGLKNPGKEKYRALLPDMLAAASGAGKRFILSVAGFKPEDYAEVVNMVVNNAPVEDIELNLGCPNVWGDGGQKPIASFDVAVTRAIIEKCMVNERTGIAFRVKVSPFSDPRQLRLLAEVVADSRVKGVTAVNTFPNGFALHNDGTPRISAGGGFAGLAGPALKGIGLGQVRQWRQALNELGARDVELIGAGGITTGYDLLDYIRAGAVAGAIASVLVKEGPSCIGRILSEYVQLKSEGEGH